MAQFGMAGGVFVTPYRSICHFCYSIGDTVPLDSETSICPDCARQIVDVHFDPGLSISNIRSFASDTVSAFSRMDMMQAPIVRHMEKLCKVLIISELRSLRGWEPGTEIAVYAIGRGFYFTSQLPFCKRCGTQDVLLPLGRDIWICPECAEEVAGVMAEVSCETGD